VFLMSTRRIPRCALDRLLNATRAVGIRRLWRSSPPLRIRKVTGSTFLQPAVNWRLWKLPWGGVPRHVTWRWGFGFAGGCFGCGLSMTGDHGGRSRCFVNHPDSVYMRHWYGAKADPRIPRHGCASLRSSPRLGMTGIFVECETRERRPNDRHQRRRWVACALRWLMPHSIPHGRLPLHHPVPITWIPG